MSHTSRRAVLKAGAAALATASVSRIARAAAAGVPGAPLKVGFVLPGPKDDGGWSEAHVRGALAMKETFGDRVEITFVERITAEPDAERVLRDLVRQGHKLIFLCSAGSPVYRVGTAHPEVLFEQCIADRLAPNVGTYDIRTHEAWAVCGTIAGLMTRTGKIGCVTSFPVPTVMLALNAFTIMARKVNPKLEVIPTWLSTFYDPARESDAARALIAQGADIVLTHNDGPAVLQIDEQKGVYTFGLGKDMSRYAPKSQLSAVVYNWGVHYIRSVRKVLEGTWKPINSWPGMADDAVRIAPYSAAVPPSVVSHAEEVRKAIVAGTLSPFDGPVTDNKGNLVIPSGKRLDGRDLLLERWFTAGVAG